MSEVTSYTPGNFCWFDLATNDQQAAKTFYAGLFGWTSVDQPMGPDRFYTDLELRGKSVGALYALEKAQLDMGIPPHWNLYVAVESADDAAKKAASLGAKVLMEPFDVMAVGRMAVVQGPEGAIFAVWEAKSHHGAAIIDEPNSFCWYEVYVHDLEKAKAFYTAMFGWEASTSPEYTEWKFGGKSIGGMMKLDPSWGPIPPNWLPCIMVTDCDATIAKATELGGGVNMGPMDIQPAGRYAVIRDPQGAAFSIYSVRQT